MHATPPNPASPSYGIAYSLGAQVSHHLMTLPRPRHLHTANPRDFDRLSIYLDHSKNQNKTVSAVTLNGRETPFTSNTKWPLVLIR